MAMAPSTITSGRPGRAKRARWSAWSAEHPPGLHGLDRRAYDEDGRGKAHGDARDADPQFMCGTRREPARIKARKAQAARALSRLRPDAGAVAGGYDSAIPPTTDISACEGARRMRGGCASSGGRVSLIAVAASLYPAVTVMLAARVIHERLGHGQRAGVLVALIGIAAIAAGT
jgi:hypothetical protein